MTRESLSFLILAFGSLAIGACIGSFLNVVIYRVPRNLSVNEPSRSFCPLCKHHFPILQNIPLVSWLLLRGKCANCRQPIPFRYFVVEALTAVIFLLIFLKFGLPISVAYWIFAALLISATYIDIDFFIIPRRISIGGAVAGILCSAALPQMMEERHWERGLIISALSAGLAFGLLWCVVELGKLAFGRKRHDFSPPETWEMLEKEGAEQPHFMLGNEEYEWWDFFSRPKDQLKITCPEMQLNGKNFENVQASLFGDRLELQGQTYPLEEIETLSGKTTSVVIPREAMGFGDVYFLAMIGAFLGWKAILFVIAVASVLGSVMALVPRLFGKVEWGSRIPFGPYLAAGGMLWLFYGPKWVDWYFSLLNPN